MDWINLAFQLTREALKSGQPEPPKPADLGAALEQQFALVDKNFEAVARTQNAQKKKLEETIRRQRIWNFVLAAGIIVVAIVAWLRP